MAPLEANFWAMARPMPLAPPVTIAALRSSLKPLEFVVRENPSNQSYLRPT